MATAAVCAVRDDVDAVLGVVGGAIALLVRCRLQVSLFEDLLNDVDVLVSSKVVLELLLARVAHNSLGALTCVEDLERVNDVGQGDGLVSSLPLLVGGSVCDDNLIEVRRIDFGLVDDLVE